MEVDYSIKFKQEAKDDVVLKAFPNFHVNTQMARCRRGSLTLVLDI